MEVLCRHKLISSHGVNIKKCFLWVTWYTDLVRKAILPFKVSIPFALPSAMKNVPISPHLQQHLIFLMFWISIILWDMQISSFFVLFCFTLLLLINNIEHFVYVCLPSGTSYLVRYLFFFTSLIRLFFLNVEFKSFLMCIICF